MGAEGPPPEVERLLERLSSLEFERGAVAGVAAQLGAYLVTLVLVVAVEDEYGQQARLSETGQLLYNGMFVEMERPIPAGGIGGLDPSYNVLLDDAFVDLVVPTVIYHAIPVVSLFVAGVVLAVFLDSRSPRAGATAGASLVVGGLIFAITGTLAFTTDSASPDFLGSLVLVGVVYPVVCGGAGGAVGSKLASLLD